MSFKKVVVAGGGVLGTQIAFQSLFNGFDASIWVRSEESIGRTKPKLDWMYNSYVKAIEGAKALIGNPMASYLYPKGIFDSVSDITVENIESLIKKAEETYKNLKIETDMQKAFSDADLVIEAMTENPDQKTAFYKSLQPYLPEKTVLCTNSSTLLPSQFASSTGREDKFLALHFANEIWKGNTAEVMGHPGTDQKYFDQVVEFAKEIKMIPLILKKEQPGYILNSLLVPFLKAAESLWANDVADPETIDFTWKLATHSPTGPFQILDVVGLKTAYEVNGNNPQSKIEGTIENKISAKLKEKIDKGELGASSGKGFFDYTKK